MTRDGSLFEGHAETGHVLLGGDLTAYAIHEPYFVPAGIELVEDSLGRPALTCKYEAGAQNRKAGRPEKCLSAFMALHAAGNQPKKVLAFARTYGLLGICAHRRYPGAHTGWWLGVSDCPWCSPELTDRLGLPSDQSGMAQRMYAQIRNVALSGHVAAAQQALDLINSGEVGKTVTAPRRLDEMFLHPEPVHAWVELADEARAILGILADLNDFERVGGDDVILHPDDWHVVREMTGEKQRGVSVAWRALVHAADRWYNDMAPPLTRLGLRSLEFRALVYAMYSRHLRSTLAMQFAAAMTSPMGVYRCSLCKKPYHPLKRRPKSGQRNYCPPCRDNDYKKPKAALGREKSGKVKAMGVVSS